MYICILVYVLYNGHRGQKRASDLWELETQMPVSYLTWVPGIELRSSTREVCALTH